MGTATRTDGIIESLTIIQDKVDRVNKTIDAILGVTPAPTETGCKEATLDGKIDNIERRLVHINNSMSHIEERLLSL